MKSIFIAVAFYTFFLQFLSITCFNVGASEDVPTNTSSLLPSFYYVDQQFAYVTVRCGEGSKSNTDTLDIIENL